MQSPLQYTDDDDRLYGATGMALALFVCGGSQWLRSATLDPADGATMIDMDPAFYYGGSPAVTPVATRRHQLQTYGLAVALTLANAMCRRMVLAHRRVTQDEYSVLLRAAEEDGLDLLGLEPDEVRMVFSHYRDKLDRAFGHPGICKAAVELASTLREHRTLSQLELRDRLHRLGLL